MLTRLLACLLVPLCLGSASPAFASAKATDVVNRAVDGFVRPGYAKFHQATSEMAAAQTALCKTPSQPSLEKARQAFGKSIFDYQNTRFKLADAKAQFTMLRAFVDQCLTLVMQGELTPETGAMAKLVGSEMQGRLLDEFLQLHGGYGFMSEYKVSRAWVDARVARIYGGTSEIMKEVIGRGLGL